MTCTIVVQALGRGQHCSASLKACPLRRQGLAWTYVHLLHGAVTYPLLHWNKGSPVQLDQGRYDGLTFWEQLDDGVQHTATRKFFTAVPACPPGRPPFACFCIPVLGFWVRWRRR